MKQLRAFLQLRRPACYILGMGDKRNFTVRGFSSPDAMKADEYRYWQSRPAHERIDAVMEITLVAYQLKGISPDVQGLRRSLVYIERSKG